MVHAIVPAVGLPRATYDDLLAVPEHLVAELIDGELITSPRPAPPHALAASAIGSVLFDRFAAPVGGTDQPGGWWILYEPELHLGDDVLVPDLAGWRRERMHALPTTAFFAQPPDWVCEVISPASGRLDRVRKMPIYGRCRVAHLWLVDPASRTLEAYRLEDGRWVVADAQGGPSRVHVVPFDDVEVDMGRWWASAE